MQHFCLVFFRQLLVRTKLFAFCFVAELLFLFVILVIVVIIIIIVNSDHNKRMVTPSCTFDSTLHGLCTNKTCIIPVRDIRDGGELWGAEEESKFLWYLTTNEDTSHVVHH